MSSKTRREAFLKSIKKNSLVVSFAGIPVHSNADGSLPFEVNSQFFYLTGIERPRTALVMMKTEESSFETLFIVKADPLAERWTGKMMTREEAQELSGISDVQYLDAMESVIGRYLSRFRVKNAYFDLSSGPFEIQDYNFKKAQEFMAKYPAVRVKDLSEALTWFRESKDEDEIAAIRKAVAFTKDGLEYVMKKLKPGKMEYQVQADFEYKVKASGAKKLAFSTIAGAGLNGCMMHYGTNHCKVEDGKLILLDLGAKYGNYCSDITRTYPANGKFSPRQREVYELVLKANREVALAARPGLTLKDLNDLTKKVLGEGLVEMGLIEKPEDVGKYYMHSVSHSIGIDCHDACIMSDVLRPGWVISDEPGLYIDEEEIGIRIEDDLLITEDGCEVLSAEIIRDPDEIEAFMQGSGEQ